MFGHIHYVREYHRKWDEVKVHVINCCPLSTMKWTGPMLIIIHISHALPGDYTVPEYRLKPSDAKGRELHNAPVFFNSGRRTV